MDDGVGSFDRLDLVAVDDQGSEERSRAMLIIGCDFHTRYQQMAMLDEAPGELIERHLDPTSGEAQAFYRELQGPVRVGALQLLEECIIMSGGSEAAAREDFKPASRPASRSSGFSETGISGSWNTQSHTRGDPHTR